jgi:predicted glycogen debranching enzyme
MRNGIGMIELGRDVLNSFEASTQREWLITNGTGSYAAGTISGVMTRRYHGLLVAALQPPLGRTVLVSKIDETISYDDHHFELYSNQWQATSSPTPHGFEYLNSFVLDGTTPTWTYIIRDALLEKRIWMHYGRNTTYICYTLLRGTLPAHLLLKILVNYKDFHMNIHADDWHMEITPIEQGLVITAFPGATKFTLHTVGQGYLKPQHMWYRDYFLAQEADRGLDATGDHLLAAIAGAQLEPGQSFTVVCSTETDPDMDVQSSYRQKNERERALLARSRITDAPDWINQLVLAADQFIVRRKTGNSVDGCSIIAGYPWFGDWGRDTMISLPGLTLSTGRYEEAASILRTYAKYVDQGMLPNRVLPP